MLFRRIFSVLYWSFWAVSSALLFFVALAIFLVTYPFDRNRKVLHLFSCFWAQLYFYVNPFWRCTVYHRDRLPWRGPAVLVANHESLCDILVLFGLYRPFKWVSKASVFRAPFLGWNMKLNGYVGIVRGDVNSRERMMSECKAWLSRGVPVLLFPEGTRSTDGEVQAFKDGAFRLALEAKVPVIPIAITGTANTLPKHGFVLNNKSDCRVEVLAAVPTEQFGADFAALREHVRALIIDGKRALEASPAKAP